MCFRSETLWLRGSGSRRRRAWVVVVEPGAGFDSQPALLNVGTQQLAGSFRVLGVFGAIVLFDVQHDVQANLIHHSERPGGAGVELEHLVDVPRCGHAFGDDLEAFPLHRCPYPVEIETGTLLACWFAAPALRERNVLVLPFGTGRTSPIATSDVARAVVAVLVDPANRIGDIYELTGPVSLDIDGLAAEYSLGLGRPIRGTDIPQDTWVAEVLKPLGLPAHLEQHLATMALLHRAGRYDRATDDVESSPESRHRRLATTSPHTPIYLTKSR
jgi:hypothetical protein